MIQHDTHEYRGPHNSPCHMILIMLIVPAPVLIRSTVLFIVTILRFEMKKIFCFQAPRWLYHVIQIQYLTSWHWDIIEANLAGISGDSKFSHAIKSHLEVINANHEIA